jgi:septal ring factor EnvC (AmiA/AmiB activator)
LKTHIDRLKTEESELNKTLENLNKELGELDEKRHQVSTENDVLKGHAAQFDKEKISSEAENARCLEEKEKVLAQQSELMRRLEELKET